MPQRTQKLELKDSVRYLLDECRMVLPGVQALFGFQLIAVFNSTFSEKLSKPEQILHLFAIALTAVTAALLMSLAAYHRQTGPEEVREDLIIIFTRLLLWSMFPLLLAISLDFYLIARLILDDKLLSLLAALLVGVVYVGLWFLLPRFRRVRAAAK